MFFLIMAILSYLVAFCCCVFYWQCKYYETAKKLNSILFKPKGVEMSTEELKKLVEQYDKEEDFTSWVTKYLKENHSNDWTPNVEPLVDIVDECSGYECPASPSREDCCNNCGSDGKCHHYVNLSKVVGVEEIKNNPAILSEQEIKELTEALNSYWKSH